MTTTEASIDVVSQGCLEVLSIGKGDLKLQVGGDNPEDIEKARAVIEEMLRKGYGLFVETDEGLTRVQRFNPNRMTYVIVEVVEEPPALAAGAPTPPALPPGPKTAAKPRGRRTRTKEVPLAGSKATVIGRTAGG
jgi:hypothetical protein